MREIRTSGLMSGDWKRNYGTNCDTGMGESRRQTVQPRSLRPPRQSSTLLAMFENKGWPPRVVRGEAFHPAIASSLNQTVRTPALPQGGIVLRPVCHSPLRPRDMMTASSVGFMRHRNQTSQQ